MRPLWCDILDHRTDPGRFTLIRGDGLVATANEDGSILFRRKCVNPAQLVKDLSREFGVRIVKPGDQKELLKKINKHLNEPKPDDEE